MWGIPREWTSFPIILTGLILWLVYLGLVYKLASRIGGEKVGFWSALGVSVWLPISYWFTSGLETGLVATLLVGVVYRMITRGVDGWVLGMVGAAMWTRLEVGLPLMVGAGWRYMMDKDRRGGILLGLTTLVSAASVLVWQKGYYGDFLPLTYYLKQTGIGREVLVLNGLWATVWHVGGNLPLYVLVAWGLFSYRMDFLKWGLPVGMALSVGLYNIWVGGDAWEGLHISNRYWSLAVGLWSVGLGLGLDTLGGLGMRVLMLGMVTIGFSPRVKNLIDYSMTLEGLHSLSIFYKEVVEAKKLVELVESGAKIGIGTAGTLPYFSEGYRYYDLLGKNTPEIAHLPMHKGHYKGGLWQVYLGHSKWNISFVEKWGLDVVRAKRPLPVSYPNLANDLARLKGYCVKVEGDYHIYFREGSPKVRWEKNPCD
ncbi:MAG: hypothetical protein ACUVRD_04175 [Bacteroidia bacterium]